MRTQMTGVGKEFYEQQHEKKAKTGSSDSVYFCPSIFCPVYFIYRISDYTGSMGQPE